MIALFFVRIIKTHSVICFPSSNSLLCIRLLVNALYILGPNTLMMTSSRTPFRVASEFGIISVISSFRTIYRSCSAYFTFVLNRAIISCSTSRSQISRLMRQLTGPPHRGKTVVTIAFKSLWTPTLLIALHMYSSKTFVIPSSEAFSITSSYAPVKSGRFEEISGTAVGLLCVSLGGLTRFRFRNAGDWTATERSGSKLSVYWATLC
jgi:hypothetical protein